MSIGLRIWSVWDGFWVRARWHELRLLRYDLVQHDPLIAEWAKREAFWKSARCYRLSIFAPMLVGFAISLLPYWIIRFPSDMGFLVGFTVANLALSARLVGLVLALVSKQGGLVLAARFGSERQRIIKRIDFLERELGDLK